MEIIEHLAPEIESRKSVTNWSKRDIENEAWDLLFEAARRAPSSWNHQPARYDLVTSKEAKKRVADGLHRTNRWAERAAGLIVQCAAPEDDDRVNGKDYYLYDCGLAMMSLIYQAEAMGITARQMIGWEEPDIKQALGIPARYRVVVITALGYPSHSPLSRTLADAKRTLTGQHKRYQMEHLVSHDRWQEGEGR